MSFRGKRFDCITVGRLGAWLAAAVALGLTGVAAAPGSSGTSGQFSSGVNLIEVYASVTAADGEPVTGLTQADFEVRESGALQTISNFAAGEFPLSVAVAVDRSFSMAGPRLALVTSAARVFFGELRPQDESMLIAIGSEVEVLAPLSTDRATQLAAVARLDLFGSTRLHDAIVKAIDAVQPAKGRRAVVLLSDGDDRDSRTTLFETLDRARESDVMIYPVAVGPARPPLFPELATLTGGRSFHTPTAPALTAAVRAIARELRQQYMLGYTPSRPIVAGSNEWRSIAVSVKRPGVQVRARDGYLIK